VELLLSFVPSDQKQGVVNALDGSGRTPLMEAASIPDSASGLVDEIRPQLCRLLIDSGANLCMRNAYGMTALGLFREKRRAYIDTSRLFDNDDNGGLRGRKTIARALTIERMLMPAAGPTAADDHFVVHEPADPMATENNIMIE